MWHFLTDDFVATLQDSDEEFQMLFNEISQNCPSNEYIQVDNNLVKSEEFYVSPVNWRETLQQELLEEVTNVETINQFQIEDKYCTKETSSFNVITAKEGLPLLNIVHLFITFNEGNKSLQRVIEDIINMVEDINIRSKKQASLRNHFHC